VTQVIFVAWNFVQGEERNWNKQFSQFLTAVLVCGTTLAKIISSEAPSWNIKLWFVEPSEPIWGSKTVLKHK
jgi:NADPH-dependent ferric siderophore reductase